MIPMMVAYRNALFLLALAEWPQTAAAELPAGTVVELASFLEMDGEAFAGRRTAVVSREAELSKAGRRVSRDWPSLPGEVVADGTAVRFVHHGDRSWTESVPIEHVEAAPTEPSQRRRWK